MAKPLKYNSTPLKSREDKSNLIKGNVYSAKINLPKVFDPSNVLKSSDLGNGYHIFTKKINNK